MCTTSGRRHRGRYGAITGIKLDLGESKDGLGGKKRARNKLSELEKSAVAGTRR